MEYPRTRRPSVDDRDHFLRKSIKNSFFFKYFYENVSTMRPTGTGSVPEDTDKKKSCWTPPPTSGSADAKSGK